MRVAVIVFPGSNCDHDVYHVLKHVAGIETRFVWHRTTDLAGFDGIVLPGGFSYGDYLRSGAMAALSPVMREVSRLARTGTPVLGICNGFQILCEAGLLPGALRRNAGLRFLCRKVAVRVERADTLFTSRYARGQVLHLPVANFDGCYEADERTLDTLEGEGRVVFRYVVNPNGSRRDIAGIINPAGNVLGMMPHPERVCEPILGGVDGLALFQAMAGLPVAA
jgi:phosphoribosylformylglycinamidine synthase